MVCASAARADTPVEVEQGVAEEAEVEVGPSASATDHTAYPRKLLFGNPDKINVQISPDGRFLSYAAPVDGVLNVWVGPVDDPAAARPVTGDTFGESATTSGRRRRSHRLPHGLARRRERASLFRRIGYRRDLGLDPKVGARAVIVGSSPKFPNELLVGLNGRDPR